MSALQAKWPTGILLLEDGTIFPGYSFGYEPKEIKNGVIGEIVFNTAMSGYQEILSDPSYYGQIVVMTYPHIGNYGVNDEDVESRMVKLSALVVHEYSAHNHPPLFVFLFFNKQIGAGMTASAVKR